MLLLSQLQEEMFLPVSPSPFWTPKDEKENIFKTLPLGRAVLWGEDERNLILRDRGKTLKGIRLDFCELGNQIGYLQVGP